MATQALVPVYQLYGENEHWPTPDMVHCELIADRSKLHDWQIKLHQHHGLMQLLYLKGGDARVGLDGRYQDMHAGQLVVVPQMCVHGFRFAPNAVGHVVTLGYPLANRLAQGIDDAGLLPVLPHVHTVRPEQSTRIDMLFDILQEEYLCNRPDRSALIESMLTTLLVWVRRQMHTSALEPAQAADRGRRHFSTFNELIEKHYAEQWPVERYARQIGITPAHLNNLCRQIVGHSALELIHQRVVLAAKRNLVYTSMTISVVSHTLGFSDPAYFTRFFKREVGVSPREFRRQAATLLE
ncbi:MAG TPA: helix-turn-helix domain-containing protein [Pusillimonas sp.]|uniref:helix-turn-helix domain-containing protein n=1 Tax=Pusillimonas sp. TaxID=3040095 RepID=UPI002CDBEEAD|nr:helix-turn-helix domain-containing protein [Pusillimonas sp.]HUH88737.1 helix-turn-helix domain-containing protein [Pusillimonas sp.]